VLRRENFGASRAALLCFAPPAPSRNANGDRGFLPPHHRTSSTFLRFPRLSRPVLLSANSTSDTANDSHVAPNGTVVRKHLIRSTTALATFSLVGAVFRPSRLTLSARISRYSHGFTHTIYLSRLKAFRRFNQRDTLPSHKQDISIIFLEQEHATVLMPRRRATWSQGPRKLASAPTTTRETCLKQGAGSRCAFAPAERYISQDSSEPRPSTASDEGRRPRPAQEGIARPSGQRPTGRRRVKVARPGSLLQCMHEGHTR
jgi:hypothetical protein